MKRRNPQTAAENVQAGGNTTYITNINAGAVTSIYTSGNRLIYGNESGDFGSIIAPFAETTQTAQNAQNDADGNDIISTYATKEELAQAVISGGGIYEFSLIGDVEGIYSSGSVPTTIVNGAVTYAKLSQNVKDLISQGGDNVYLFDNGSAPTYSELENLVAQYPVIIYDSGEDGAKYYTFSGIKNLVYSFAHVGTEKIDFQHLHPNNTWTAGSVSFEIPDGSINISKVDNEFVDDLIDWGELATTADIPTFANSDEILIDSEQPYSFVIAQGAVNRNHLADNSVRTENITANAVTENKLSQAVQNKLNNWEVINGQMETSTPVYIDASLGVSEGLEVNNGVTINNGSLVIDGVELDAEHLQRLLHLI